MSGPPKALPMGPADSAWLHMDRPTNQMVINALMRMRQPLSMAALERVIETRLTAAYPKFAMLVREGPPLTGPLRLAEPLPLPAPLGLSGPRWEADPHFDLSRHIHLVALPGPGDEDALRALVGDIVSMPLPHDRPLWQMHLIERPDGAPPALLVRMHHCIADGIALARVLLSLTDDPSQSTPAGAAPKAAHPTPLPSEPAAAADRSKPSAGAGQPSFTGLARGALSLAAKAPKALLHPGRTVKAVLHDVSEGARGVEVLARLLVIPPDPRSAMKQPLTGTRRVGWCEQLSLREVKEVAHRHRATVNDVLISVVSGALRAQMLAIDGVPTRMRAIVPFNLRPASEPIPRDLGNRFGLVFLDLPVEVGDRRRRLLVVKARMDAIKRSPEGMVSYGVLQAMGLAPDQLESRFVSLFSSKGSAVVTNVPGPQRPRALAGAEVDDLQVWAPTSGSVGMSVSILSYDGRVSVGLMTDESLAADPQAIADLVPAELAATLALRAPSSSRRSAA